MTAHESSGQLTPLLAAGQPQQTTGQPRLPKIMPSAKPPNRCACGSITTTARQTCTACQSGRNIDAPRAYKAKMRIFALRPNAQTRKLALLPTCAMVHSHYTTLEHLLACAQIQSSMNTTPHTHVHAYTNTHAAIRPCASQPASPTSLCTRRCSLRTFSPPSSRTPRSHRPPDR